MLVFVGSPLSSATPSYPLPPKITKQTINQLSAGHIWLISICMSTFRSWGGGVEIKLKANLSSTGTELGNSNISILMYLPYQNIQLLIFCNGQNLILRWDV